MSTNKTAKEDAYRFKKQLFIPYLYLLPLILLLAVFVYLPMFKNFEYMFQQFTVFSPQRKFIGLENVRTLFFDEAVGRAIINNIWYCVLSVFFQVFISLVCASLLEDKLFRRIAVLYRTMFFIPVLISMTVIAMLFSLIYFPKGLLNSFLELFSANANIGWLGRTDTAIFCTIAMSQWHSMGYTMMLFIVTIQKIPEDLYDSAEIDGTNRVQRFFHITIPQVNEMIFVTMVVTVSGAFLVFKDVYILTKSGGPGNSSVTLAVHMYNMAFTQDRMGYASAIAVLMLVICLFLALIQKKSFHIGKRD